MIVFNNHLYALRSGSLYQLKSSTFNDIWSFKEVEWSPTNISYINASLNGRCLFVKTDEFSYLYDDTFYNEMIKRSIDKRVYGYDKRTFIDFKGTTCKIYIDKEKVKTLHDIRSAVINKNNELFLVKVSDCYRDVRIVNHQPYYIK